MDTHQTVNPHIYEFHLGLEETNRHLEEYVRNEIAKVHTLGLEEKHSNIGGWHSERNLHTRLGEHTAYTDHLLRLFAAFENPMNEYIKNCHEKFGVRPLNSYHFDYTASWFNVAFGGSYNAPHIHPLSQISAAYYVRTEEPTKEYPFSGRIDLIENNTQYPFSPKSGTLLLFPSDMLHWVHPYHGSDIRICLSFNAGNISTA